MSRDIEGFKEVVLPPGQGAPSFHKGVQDPIVHNLVLQYPKTCAKLQICLRLILVIEVKPEDNLDFCV
ncbi:hypothetical protein Prudu_1494S000300 [Prunus dulcis]|uniref:Uncharacterized protein n=1 Tax=Prunus dulcis TaxID=3755 RepID=A0A5H2YHH3_PRUDU|nr:hypothetical protein Prudu_1494S000300 [Prunus dulcis]